MAWDYFRDGHAFDNFKILEIVEPTQRKATTTYSVLRFCCGKVETISHKRLREMLTTCTPLCVDCSRKANGENSANRQYPDHDSRPSINFTAPSWSPPPMAMELVRTGEHEAR